MATVTWASILFGLQVFIIYTEALELHGSQLGYVNASLGAEAIMQCRVTSLEDKMLEIKLATQNVTSNTINSKVTWTNVNRGEILTAGNIRITSDPRFSVLHELGSDHWDLKVINVTSADEGNYTCQVNTDPPQMAVESLFVAVENVTTDIGLIDWNVTDCCLSEGLSEECLDLCSSSLELNKTFPANCKDHVKGVLICMTDGQNHMQCCANQKVPWVCQGLCMGDWNLTEAGMTFCLPHMPTILQCFKEELVILPDTPVDVTVELLNSSTLLISWKPPINTPVNFYIVEYKTTTNMSWLDKSDHNEDAIGEVDRFDLEEHQRSRRESNINVTTVQVNSTSNLDSLNISSLFINETSISHNYTTASQDWGNSIVRYTTSTSIYLTDLYPMAKYDIYITAVNNYGSSSPVKVEAWTVFGTVDGMTNTSVPSPPDVRECCIQGNVTPTSCVDLFCDPLSGPNSMDVPPSNLLLCGKQVQKMFQCMSDGGDHTPCCQSRGVPRQCWDLCNGTFHSFNFEQMECLRYISTYTVCMLHGFGLLPGAPRNVTVIEVLSTKAIISWAAPGPLEKSVYIYRLHYKKTRDLDAPYTVIHSVSSPYTLDQLEPDTDYVAHIIAENQYDVSHDSAKVLFTTLSSVTPLEMVTTVLPTTPSHNMNFSACCMSEEVSVECLPLCSYSVPVHLIYSSPQRCQSDLNKLLRCGADGRNHRPCCRRRSVINSCLSLCEAETPPGGISSYSICLDDLPSILQCYEEGLGILPGRPRSLIALEITNSSVVLQWLPPLQNTNTVTQYQVLFLEEGANQTMTLNTSDTEVTINSLKSNTTYIIYIISWNLHGVSLPSYSISLRTHNQEFLPENMTEMTEHEPPSMPLYLTVENLHITSILLSWHQPNHNPTNETLVYTVYYKKANKANSPDAVNTTSTRHNLTGLQPDILYDIYITAWNIYGESSPSLSLQASTMAEAAPFIIISANPERDLNTGDNVTLECLATGEPQPKLRWLQNGTTLKETLGTSLVVTVTNITQRLINIRFECEAENGIGPPLREGFVLNIRYPPKLSLNQTVYVLPIGSTINISCYYDAYPFGKAYWLRLDTNGNMTFAGDGRTSYDSKLEYSKHRLDLILTNIEEEQFGKYICKVENELGSSEGIIEVTMEIPSAEFFPPVTSVVTCCQKNHVTPACQKACSFDIDINVIWNQNECLPDLPKFIACSADGADHRRCCKAKNVPVACLDICEGSIPLDLELHCLSHSKEIMTCFSEGKEILPGPPQHLQAEVADNGIRVTWFAPIHNADRVIRYTVVYMPSNNATHLQRRNTQDYSVRLTDLLPGIKYIIYVVAENHHGASPHSKPITVTIEEKHNAKTNKQQTTGIGIGIILSLVAVAALIFGFYMLCRRKTKPKFKDSVAFENPGYMTDTQMGIQISGLPEEILYGGDAPESGWRSAELHVPGTDYHYDERSYGFDDHYARLRGEDDDHFKIIGNSRA